MRKFLIPLAAVAVIAATAVPAAAQQYRGDYAGRDYNRGYERGGQQQLTGRVDGLEWQINNATREGRISRGEARNLMAELRQLQPMAWRVQTGEASGWERQRLSQGVNRIERAVRDDGRYGRGGYDRDTQDGRYDYRHR